ncbi:MAG: energy transducer TonB [Candidatus Dadabacteria bacterium]|nr:energy transducer TonB [Candidatus Dadabacteria bacterium]
MNRNREVPFPVFLLISAVLNLLLIQFLFSEILPDPESLKPALDKTFIELIEIPVKETEPPDKPSRLADKSHRAEKETTIDDTTKLSRSAPQPTKKSTVQKKPAGAIQPGEQEKSVERSSPEKDRVAIIPEGERNKPEKRKASPDQLSGSTPSASASQMVNPKIADVPFDYNTEEQLLGTKDVEKEITVDLNTTEYKYISYFTKLKERIYQVWKYPKESQARREQGNVRIVFTLRKDGYLENVRIIQPSGFENLDREVLRTIRIASPYNPFPESWEEEKLKIPATFDYKLPKWVRYYN